MKWKMDAVYVNTTLCSPIASPVNTSKLQTSDNGTFPTVITFNLICCDTEPK